MEVAPAWVHDARRNVHDPFTVIASDLDRCQEASAWASRRRLAKVANARRKNRQALHRRRLFALAPSDVTFLPRRVPGAETLSRSAGATTVRRARELLVAIALSALLPLCPGVSAATRDDLRTVVVLTPDNAVGSPGSVSFKEGLRATLEAQSPKRIQIRFEPLDISRFQDARDRELLVDFLRQKYSGQKIDLLIAALAPSLDFALQYRQKIFPGVPLVFAALDAEEVRAHDLPADVIGTPIEMDLVGTLELALRLQPETRRVFVIVGSSSFDARWEGMARQRFGPYENRLEFVYLSGLSMNDLLKRVANLPDHSIVQYLHMFEDAAGKTFIPADALKLVASKANAPIYGHAGSYIGLGIVGGHVMSFELAAKNAASLGLRILAGERPEAISAPAASSNEYVVDWRQLRRWDLSEAALPAGTDVRYREPSLWDLYRWQIVGASCLFVLETALIVALLAQIAHRRTAEQELRLSQTELRTMTGRLLQAQEGESRRIARELHDDLGQGLALLSVQMDLLRQKPAEAANQLSARMQEMLRQIRQLSSSVHELSHQLHPAKLEQLGIAAAIRGLCHELAHRHGLKIEFAENQILSPISPDTALCLYRIAQEALANAIKHSGAAHVRVELGGSAEKVSLRIADDGAGFDPESIHGKSGLGLVSMRERVFSLGGVVAIDSQPSGGTRVSVRLPVSAPAPTA
jgi:signal transduction histidine kinase